MQYRLGVQINKSWHVMTDESAWLRFKNVEDIIIFQVYEVE